MTRTLHKSRILLVERSQTDARQVGRLLQEVSADHDVTHVSSMNAALQALAGDAFDFALLELGLPDGRGLENIERLINVAPELPIVVLTSLHDDRTATGAKAYGARGHLVKGTVDTGADLEASIQRLLRNDPEHHRRDPHTAPEDGFDVDVQGRVTDWSPAATELMRDHTDAMQLAAIFQSTTDIIIATTLDERITHWNPGAEQTLGYAEDEIVGRSLRELVPADQLGWLQERIEETRRGQRIDRFDTRLRHREGHGVDVSINFVPMRDQRGGISGLVVVATDITERKRAEAALREGSERIRAIVETVPDSIITIDENGLIERLNPAAERLFGYADEELVGRNVNVLMPESYAGEHDGYIARYLRTGERRIIGIGREVQARKKNGEVFPIELAVGEVRLGERRLFTGVIRDITARKQAEAALESEVAERTAANDELRETLRRLQEAQGQLVQAEKLASLGGLVAGVAHEINTPVGVAVTAASHLHNKTAELQAAYDSGTLKRSDLTGYIDQGRQATEIILTNLRRAAELIHSFKQVAVDQSSSERRRFKVREYLEETLISLRPKLKNTAIDVRLVCDADLVLDSVPGAFSQIVTNLLMNSLLHAYEPGDSGTIRILARQDDDGFRLTYSDDGKGMTPETLERIFDPFFTTRRGSGGTGLGMHVVYNLIKRKLGGEIEIDSQTGAGMRLEMRLPVKAEEAIG